MISVSLAVQSDTPELVPLFSAMLVHYDHHLGEDDATIGGFLTENLFGPAPTVYCQIVRDNDRAVGFVTYTFVVPGVGLGRELFVKELYTADAARGRGAGKALMVALAKIANSEGCRRMRWITGRGNDYQAARGLYSSLGAKRLDEAVVYAMDQSAIDRLSGAISDGG